MSEYVTALCYGWVKIDHTHARTHTHNTALALAISRDGSSGGVIRLAAVEEGGVERTVLTGHDIPQFYSD